MAESLQNPNHHGQRHERKPIGMRTDPLAASRVLRPHSGPREESGMHGLLWLTKKEFPQIGTSMSRTLLWRLDICTDTRYGILVISSFRHRGLKRLYDGDPSKVSADQARRIGTVLGHLDRAQRPSDLDLPGYRVHALKGDLKGMWSVTISGTGESFSVLLTAMLSMLI